MKVICISGKAQHGKDTIANMLKEHYESNGSRVLVFHFADLVKYVCTKFFDWDGNKDEHGRSLLQFVGTDAVRTQSPNYWVNFLTDMLKFFPDKWDYVLAPDCRFPNEYEQCVNAGADTTLLRIERTNFSSGLTDEQKNHPSETSLDNYGYDIYVRNNGSEDWLRNEIPRIAAQIDGGAY